MFFDTDDKKECFGCEACVQSCGANAITMQEDDEGFCYPVIDDILCLNCNRCREVCPYEHMPDKHEAGKYVFGGYNVDPEVRFDSTSGGAFSAIADAFCDENYVIIGAEAKGLLVFHSYVTDKKEIWRFRKSKYSQSIMGTSYRKAAHFLQEGKKVLFSGTPCQIAGLLNYLGNENRANLLTVEVVCEGVPSPLYVRKMEQMLREKYASGIESIDYRYTGKSILLNGKWDFQIMRLYLREGVKQRDRWFNPFWSIWLQHLMSRPSCYHCKFTSPGRVADITLGDLWGVHKYCPELYGKNGGSSLVVCNTDKGKQVFVIAQQKMYGHELTFDEVLKYQGPMRRAIAANPDRDQFMSDLKSGMSFREINKRWAKKPSPKLLFEKYVWGNRQKVAVWNLFHRRRPTTWSK